MAKAVEIFVLFAAAAGLIAASGYPKKLNSKALEKQMVPIGKAIWMSKYECSNQWYNLFLSDLKAQGKFDQYEQYKFDTASWSATFPMGHVMPLEQIYHSHPAYNNYPAVGMSYDGATAFCAWITDWYNKQPNKKNVKWVFSLPSSREWEAAAAIDSDSLYPWKGQHLRNHKGLYMANYKNDSTSYIEDGALFQAETHSYYPNAKGLYNLAGNVAEMVMEKGNHKGGSWESDGNQIKIHAADPYDGISKAHPCIGFRVVAKQAGL
jgi:formylglycine-generating enzyme required for sulfatase activity